MHGGRLSSAYLLYNSISSSVGIPATSIFELSQLASVSPIEALNNRFFMVCLEKKNVSGFPRTCASTLPVFGYLSTAISQLCLARCVLINWMLNCNPKGNFSFQTQRCGFFISVHYLPCFVSKLLQNSSNGREAPYRSVERREMWTLHRHIRGQLDSHVTVLVD